MSPTCVHHRTIAAQSAEGTGVDLISENVALVCRTIMLEGHTLQRKHLANGMEWERRKLNLCLQCLAPKPFPICFKLLRKVNILANLSERFIGGPKCNLLGD